MEYQALIRSIHADWYDGTIYLEIDGHSFLCYYQAPLNFSVQYLTPGKQIHVDLWLGCVSMIEKLPYFVPWFPFSRETTDRRISGIVISSSEADSFRLNCETLMIDVKVDNPIKYDQGTNLMVSGSCQVFFPNTEWSYENIGCV